MALRRTPLAAHSQAIWRAGVAAADPLDLMPASMHVDTDFLVLGRRRIRLDEIHSITIVGAGKAGARMSLAVETILGARRLRQQSVRGWVNVPGDSVRKLRTIHLHPARSGHDNRPTRRALVGTKRILSFLDGQSESDLTLCLLSGGGSALLPGPASGVRLAEKIDVTERLHAAGAPIDEVNCVRKHLSSVKGGGLLRSWMGSWLTSFVLSDVPGDSLDVIASGPTSPDPTTFADAIAVLQDYAVWDLVPRSVQTCLLEGRAGRRPETLKILPPGVENVLIGSSRTAREGAARKAHSLGYEVTDVSRYLRGEASEAGRVLRRLAVEARTAVRGGGRPICLLGGGETTVRLGRRHGKGGRCQELALAALAEGWHDDWGGIAFLSAGTDGEDGPTDAAGAVLDDLLRRRAERRGMDAASFLARHDAYSFFDPLGGLFRTGPTGTNVMDLLVILVERP